MHNRAAVIRRIGVFIELCFFMSSQNKQLSVGTPLPASVGSRGWLPAPHHMCVGG